MSDTTYQCALYRYSHPDGTSKDWAICIDADVIRIFYAKTGAKMRMAVVPKNKAKHALLEDEVHDRTNEQIQQGYVHVGEASIVDKQIVQLINPNDGKKLNWDTSESIPEEEFLEKIGEIAKALGESPLPGVKVSIQEDGLELGTPGGKWSFGYQVDTNGGLNRKTGRGGGIITPSHGPVPVFVMLAVSETFPELFAFGDDDGNTVDLRFNADNPWFSQGRVPYETLRKLAVQIGVCAPSLSESNVKATGVWF